MLEDTIDPAHSTWLVFQSASRATGWLADYESTVDLPIRIRGIRVDDVPELGFPASTARLEHEASAAFAKSAERIARRSLVDNYSPQRAIDLAAASNAVLKTKRIRAAGYIRDLAVQGRSDAHWLDELVEQLGQDGMRLLRWLEESSSLQINTHAANSISTRIGIDNWEALDLRSKHFLATAATHLGEMHARADLDHSAAAVMCGKALEVELSELARTFSQNPKSRLEHDPRDRNDNDLRGFLDQDKS